MVKKISLSRPGEELVDVPDKVVKEVSASDYPNYVDSLYGACKFSDYPSQIRFKSLKLGQLKKLVYPKDDENYNEICASVLSEVCAFDPLDLIVQDFDLLILNARMMSCGGTASYDVTCGKCGKEFSFLYELTNLSITPAESDLPQIVKINDSVSIQPPRLRTLIEFNKSPHSKDPDPITNLSKYIVQGSSIDDKIGLIDNLDPSDLNKVLGYTKRLVDIGIDTHVKTKCSSCEEEVSLVLPPFRRSFFLPNII